MSNQSGSSKPPTHFEQVSLEMVEQIVGSEAHPYTHAHGRSVAETSPAIDRRTPPRRSATDRKAP